MGNAHPGSPQAEDPRGEVTRILSALEPGSGPNRLDADRLLEITYAELRRLAAHFLTQERADHTLQPTALVHEAWVRLADQQRVEWRGRSHFLSIAAQAMRRILVDHARGKKADKRGRAWQRVELDAELAGASGQGAQDFVAIDEALQRLSALAPQQARIVELRFFGGLEMAEVAQFLGMPLRTAEREWRFARVWLENQLRGDRP